MSTTAITSQTAAATSSDIAVASGDMIQIWVSPPLAVGETVTLHRYSGADEEPVVEDGVALTLDSKNLSMVVTGPVNALRLKKSVTGTATAVYYDA